MNGKLIREELVNLILQYQSNLTDDQRLDFWEEIQSEYCKRCGKLGVCYCGPEFDE